MPACALKPCRFAAAAGVPELLPGVAALAAGKVVLRSIYEAQAPCTQPPQPTQAEGKAGWAVYLVRCARSSFCCSAGRPRPLCYIVIFWLC